MQLNKAIMEYLAWHKNEGHSQWTINSVRSRLGQLAAHHPDDADITAVTGQTIDEHFHQMRDNGLAIGTLAGHKRTTKAFFRWCTDNRLINHDPSITLKRKTHSYSFDPVHSRAVPPADLHTVIESLPAFIAARNNRPRDLRDAALVSLTIDSSARRGEIYNLRRRDVEQALLRGRPLDSSRIVYQTIVAGGKTGAARIRFFNETAGMIQMWLDTMPPDAIWLWSSIVTGQRLNINALWNGFRRICEFAGVPPFRFHAVRKRAVTDIISVSGDPKLGQLYAGHKDPRTTQRYYNDIQQERVDEIASLLAEQRRGGSSSKLANAFFEGIGPKT